MANTNPLGMSDEEFLNQPGPPEEKDESSKTEGSADGDKSSSEDEAGKEAVIDNDGDGEDTSSSGSDDEGDKPNSDDIDADKETDGKGEDDSQAKDNDVDPAKAGATGVKSEGEGNTDETGKDKAGTKDSEAKADLPDTAALAAFYGRVMGPIRANGKDIQLKSVDEVVQLMQMGANYTKKMQELVPHRKILTMLENNGLLDESKLSYLIDLDKKDPNAVKKLLKDSKIDPLEVDLDKDSDYVASDHSVSNEEVDFRTTLNDLASNEEGKATLQIINTQWDEGSKEILWSKPEVMRAIHGQREIGLYDKIATEVERRKTLGMIDHNLPFLQAYTEVGNEWAAAAKQEVTAEGTTKAETTGGKPELKPIDTRAGTPKKKVTEDERVKAASPTRSNPGSSKEVKNPLAMADEDFLKQMKDRV